MSTQNHTAQGREASPTAVRLDSPLMLSAGHAAFVGHWLSHRGGQMRRENVKTTAFLFVCLN